MVAESVTEEHTDVLPILQSKDEIKAFYNKIARVYDLLAERSEQPLRDRAIDLLEPRAGQQLLEIGCGTGHTLATLAWEVGPDGNVVGVDVAENMVALARRLIESEHLTDRAHAICADAESLPFPSGSRDGIIMIFTLELFDTPAIARVLAECRRVLRPGGRLVVAGLSKEGTRGLLEKAFEWTHRHFPNLMDCRPIFIRHAVEAAGFAIEDAIVDRMWVSVEIVRGEKPAG
jgi:ubiquinone/menaquinone biosynthesis C-methylase UbiE